MAANFTGCADIEDVIRRRAFDQCSCARCADLCTGVPGVYDPAHLGRLLDGGDMSLTDLVSTCVMDEWPMSSARGSSTYYIRPRTTAEQGGTRVRDREPNARCVHLGSAGCALQRTHMPLECVSTYACRDNYLLSGRPLDPTDLTPYWFCSGLGRLLWETSTGIDLISRLESHFPRKNRQ